MSRADEVWPLWNKHETAKLKKMLEEEMNHTLYRLSFYRTRGGWRWRLKSVANGKIIGAASEAYKNGPMCLKNFVTLTGAKFPDTFRVQDKQVLVIALFHDGWFYDGA